MRKIHSVLLLLLWVLPLAAQTPVPAQKILVGVLPAYDVSGEQQGDLFVSNLTAMVFTVLQDTRVEPWLLNPGGLYTPLSADDARDFAKESGVDLMLVSTLLQVDKPRSGSWTMKVESQLVDVHNGKSSAPFVCAVAVSRNVLLRDAYRVSNFWGGTAGFEKQPLGKVASKMANDIREQVIAQAPSLASQASASPPPQTPGTCDVRFRVVYKDRKRISQAYSMIVNERDESLGIHEGVGKFSARSGPVLVKVQVNDAPYKMPTQRLYQANTYLDCGQQSRDLTLELGAVGEATLKWE